MKLLSFEAASEWRVWLQMNFDRENEVWLIFNKRATGLPSLNYEESVEEALCFGWIDSLIKRLDDNRYARKFTPRNAESKWSELNKRRVERLINTGRMTEPGMAAIEAAHQNGMWDKPNSRPIVDLEMPDDFRIALEGNPTAFQNYKQFPFTVKKQYLTWIGLAKRPETRLKRIQESVELLSKGERLGLR